MKIQKILIANRGEIALRIMRSAKEMGIQTVAIFSEADRLSPHVKYADEAICIGKAPSSESYLKGDKIIEVARMLQADAIHPGYGFLSENADFAQKTIDAGLIFIGPSPEAIRMMGSKLVAKQTAAINQVPLVLGTETAITDIQEAKQKASEIGYPILIKASAGGGGKGMRIVEVEKDFEEQMQRAVSEAIAAFGDGSVFIEKYITSPKHIEIQVLGDTHGNIVHLFERECSIQRRHQKVIEEAPSAVLTSEIRQEMGEDAVKIAQACGYYSAGTVEFIADEHLNFYFLEMNTRLQVEHPVTEMITGIDLVKEQIKIAEGQALSFQQTDLKINGHAIEIRVYAEDPLNDFLPDIGTLQTYKIPQGNGVRVDDGYEQGMEISIYYDPMIAKLIVHSPTRSEAIDKLSRAIEDYQISGIETTLNFCNFVIQHDIFQKGTFDTNFIQKYFKPEFLEKDSDIEKEIVAVLTSYLLENRKNVASVFTTQIKKNSNWKKNRI
jgi:acetyl-CoA carboxylase biotin carboxylase subunit